MVAKCELKFLKAVWGVLHRHGMLLHMKADEAASVEAIKAEWDQLSEHLQVIDTSTWREGLVNDAALSVNTIIWRGSFAEALAQARQALHAHSEENIARAEKKFDDSLEGLCLIGVGIRTGGCWKGGIDVKSWDECLAAAQTHLFARSNKGISRDIANAKAAVEKSLKEALDTAELYGADEVKETCLQASKEPLKIARVTMAEARMVQHLKDSKATQNQKEINVQADVDNLDTDDLQSQDIASGVFEKCMQAPRV